MEIILNEQTKPYVKQYYVNGYLNCVECNDLDIVNYKEDIEKLVEETINDFFKTESDLNFSKKMSDEFQKYVKKNNIKRIRTRNLFLSSKNNFKYIKNLYKYYENKMLYQIYTSGENIEKEKVEEAKELLKSYFDSVDITKINSFENFSYLIQYLKARIYHKLGINTKSARVRNEQIVVKEGSMNAKENAKEHFKSLYLNKINKYKSLLPKEKLRIYIEKVIDKLIENYFNNNPSSSIANYLSPQLDRYIKGLNDDIVLIKYARIVNNYDSYNYAIDYYAKKYKYILNEYDKNDELIEKYNKLIEEYVRNSHLKKNIELYLKRSIDDYVKENSPKRMKFDFGLARGSNEIEKQRHRHILLSEFEYKINSYKNSYTFYDSEIIVDKKLKEIYIKVIDSYISGISDIPASRYISNSLKRRFQTYSNKTKENTYIYLLNFILIENDYTEILEEYYNEHTLTYTEKGNLEEYMGLVLDEYIEKGSYKDDHKEYFRQMIKKYESINQSYVYKNKTF